MIGQVPVRFLLASSGSGNEWEMYWNLIKMYGKYIPIPRSDNFKRLDQAINSDVARALINIPMGKVDQLS